MRPVVVLEPSPLLTVTIERGARTDEIHLHAGGQGCWIARMLAALDTPVIVCAALGGEAGHVAGHLMALVLAKGYATVTALDPLCERST